jgi:hypothetical protein
MRSVSGTVPLVPDFDISEFPMEDATITVELNDGTTIIVQHARLVASHEGDKVVIRYAGVTDDENAALIEELPPARLS